MGTSSRYADHIDGEVARRRAANTAAAASSPAPASFHPRSNVYPTRWICRNGRWGTIYGEIEARDVLRHMLSATVYYATFIREGGTDDLGEFATGDQAAIALWNRFMDHIEVSSPRRNSVGNRYNPS